MQTHDWENMSQDERDKLVDDIVKELHGPGDGFGSDEWAKFVRELMADPDAIRSACAFSRPPWARPCRRTTGRT